MEKDILNIAISGDEKNKNEIVNNNIVDAMSKLKMTKDEQIDYLKTKLTVVENEYQNNLMLIITIVISVIIMILGIYLLISDEYILGILFIFVGFTFMVYKLVRVLINDRKIRNKKFIEIEGIRSNINSILK